MDKLVKLLNEYEREKEGLPKDFEDYTIWDIEGNEIVQSSCDPDSRKYFKYYIISKDYQFIKWLVENNKIDMKKHFYDKMNCVGYPDLNIVLCELAVSDTPIKDLISYLK